MTHPERASVPAVDPSRSIPDAPAVAEAAPPRATTPRCNACGQEMVWASGETVPAGHYCINKQCSRHGYTNDYNPGAAAPPTPGAAAPMTEERLAELRRLIPHVHAFDRKGYAELIAEVDRLREVQHG